MQIFLVNRRFLPKAVRAPLWREIGLLACSAFYAFFALLRGEGFTAIDVLGSLLTEVTEIAVLTTETRSARRRAEAVTRERVTRRPSIGRCTAWLDQKRLARTACAARSAAEWGRAAGRKHVVSTLRACEARRSTHSSAGQMPARKQSAARQPPCVSVNSVSPW